jgi:hypothetical protein
MAFGVPRISNGLWDALHIGSERYIRLAGDYQGRMSGGQQGGEDSKTMLEHEISLCGLLNCAFQHDLDSLGFVRLCFHFGLSEECCMAQRLLHLTLIFDG